MSADERDERSEERPRRDERSEERDGLTCECGHHVMGHVYVELQDGEPQVAMDPCVRCGPEQPCPAFRSAALARANQHLGNLLARIHRDGGHHQEAVGTDRAVQDADAQIIEWLGQDDALAAAREKIGRLREMESRAIQAESTLRFARQMADPAISAMRTEVDLADDDEQAEIYEAIAFFEALKEKP